jgi:excisionase family DNA binding protein
MGDMATALLLRVEEAAEMLGIGRSKAYAMVLTGELPSVKIGRCRRVPLSAVHAWIEAHLEGQVHQAA